MTGRKLLLLSIVLIMLTTSFGIIGINAESAPISITRGTTDLFTLWDGTGSSKGNDYAGTDPDQFRVGLGPDVSEIEFNNCALGLKIPLTDFTDDFIKSAELQINIKQHNPIAGHIYKTDLYNMTTDWTMENKSIVLNNGTTKLWGHWNKEISTYTGYPNKETATVIDSCDITANTAVNNLDLTYDVTGYLNEQLIGNTSDAAFALINKRYRENSGSCYNDVNCFDSRNVTFSLNVIKYDTVEEKEEAISNSVKDITEKSVANYIKHFDENSAYFEFSDKNELNKTILAKRPQNKDDLMTALSEAMVKEQVETSPYNNESEVSLKTKQITIKASRNGENKQLVSDGNFILKDSTGSIVATTLSNGVLSFSENLKDEETYTLTWTGITGIENGNITFKTTGTYTYLDAQTSKNILSIGETADFSAKGVFEKSKLENTIPNSKITVTVDDPTIVSYENGQFKALKRGITDASFSFTNENEVVVTMKKKIAVYRKHSENEVGEFKNEYISCYVTANDGVTLTTEYTFIDSYKHQLVVYNDELYIDGVKYGTANINTLMSNQDVTFENINYSNINGDICTAEFVNAVYVTNSQVEGIYTYDDKDGDTESGTELKWYYSSSQSGPFTLIAGANELNLTSYQSYRGYYVQFEVTPKNMYDNGVAVRSQSVYITPNVTVSESVGGSSSGGGGRAKTVAITKPQTEENKKEEQKEEKQSFIDVDKDYWAYEYINNLSLKGILNGKGDNRFMPNDNVTRAEFVCALLKTMGDEINKYNQSFSDVRENDWYADYIGTAVTLGYLKGFSDNTIQPNENITREQMAVVVSNACKLSNNEKSAFYDYDTINDWAKESVDKMYNEGFINGNENNMFMPQNNATRGEMAKILSLILKSTEEK